MAEAAAARCLSSGAPGLTGDLHLVPPPPAAQGIPRRCFLGSSHRRAKEEEEAARAPAAPGRDRASSSVLEAVRQP